MRPGGAKANADLLDHGTLYVACSTPMAVASGIELTPVKNGLTADALGFTGRRGDPDSPKCR